MVILSLGQIWSAVLAVVGVFVALGLSIPFLYKLSQDRRKAALEATDLESALLHELQSVTQVHQELWAALGPHHDQIVQYYVRGGATRPRADMVIDYWTKVARMFREKRVNQRRFLPRIGPACNGAWADYALLIKYFDATQPSRLIDLHWLQKIVERDIRRNKKVLGLT